MSKGYNPFKMWGSYVGAGLLAFPMFLAVGLQIAGMILGCPSRDMGLFFVNMCKASVEGWLYYLQVILAGIISLTPGFFVGWGVHSLVRWIRSVV